MRIRAEVRAGGDAEPEQQSFRGLSLELLAGRSLTGAKLSLLPAADVLRSSTRKGARSGVV